MTSEQMEDLGESQTFNSTLSLYIPIVENNINEDTMKTIFAHENLGTISRIDFVYNNLGKKQAFIHFSEWFNTPKVCEFQAKVMNSKQKARLNINPGKYWPVYPNHNPLAERPPHLNLIDVLQDKIASLEHKLSEISFQYSNQDEVPSKRPRNTFPSPLASSPPASSPPASSPVASINLVLPSNLATNAQSFGMQH